MAQNSAGRLLLLKHLQQVDRCRAALHCSNNYLGAKGAALHELLVWLIGLLQCLHCRTG